MLIMRWIFSCVPPSAMAEEVIWQRFMQTYMTEATIKDCDAIEKENLRLSHRPLHES